MRGRRGGWVWLFTRSSRRIESLRRTTDERRSRPDTQSSGQWLDVSMDFRLSTLARPGGSQIWQPDLTIPITLLSIWLAQVEANLAAGHVTDPNKATTEASSVACKECGIDVAIWWPDGASIHASWMACRGIRNSRTRRFASVNKNVTIQKASICSSIERF